MLPEISARFHELKAQIERSGDARLARSVLPFEVPVIDTMLPNGGLAYGALHEIAGGAHGAIDGAAAISFAAGIAARTGGLVLWAYIQPDLFAPALALSGLANDRVVFFEGGDEASVLGCCEEALRHGGLTAVVGELSNLTRVASQRLQMAAETTGTIALVVRRWRRQVDARDFGTPTAAFTRWRVTALNSEPLPVRGVGRSRWQLELMRTRGGGSGDFEVEACDEKGAIRLSAALADRSIETGCRSIRAAS
ncbi:ImuA family protein [Asticcacaulis tiandongensis]|uniref:ImuA family protein n=1 Tax=Asticcacaulis tiandongensis TaxID=2565365 RepID=UPI001128490A|nr:damage-inducible protein [Asticcacaulis tiandongensis]